MNEQDLLARLLYKVLVYIQYKPRSKTNILRKIDAVLVKLVSEDESINLELVKSRLLAILEEGNYLNDNAHLTLYVKDYLASSKAKSPREFETFLRKQGFSTNDIATAFQAIPEDVPLSKAISLVDKFFKKIEVTHQTKQKCILYLQRKGYTYSVAKAAVDRRTGLK